MFELPGYRRIADGGPGILLAEHETTGLRVRLHEVDLRGRDGGGGGVPLGLAQTEVQLAPRVGRHALSAELVPASSGDLFLAIEHPEGRSLASVLEAPRNLAESLAVAIGLTRAVDAVHRASLVHGSLRPDAAHVGGDGTVRLTSLGTAFRPGNEVSRPPYASQLHYVAPELTARINGPVDERADLYSLGALLVHLFSGRPLFAAADPLDLVHAHFARAPERLDVRVSGFPEELASIVERLVAKAPEARYQTAAGLLSDLEAFARGERRFALGARDASRRLVVTTKLYGREKELAALKAALDRLRDRKSALVCVAGYSGVGKSALVRQLSPSVLALRGLFGDGKFDAYGDGTPASAFVEAFRRIASTFLGASESELTALRASLGAKLGPWAPVVADAIPAFELILGKQPPLPPLGAQEAQNRFALAFDRLVTALTDEGHPLVLFIDDLQWADALSLKLLTTLAGDPERPFLLVGAYRDNEVGEAHPVSVAFAALEKAGTSRVTVELGPLSADDVHQLVADTVRRPRDEAAPLADLLASRTNGNPFFLGQIFRTLHEEGAIRFDEETFRFTWDLDAIAQADITDNVVAFLSQRIADFPATTRALVSTMAVLGTSFSAEHFGVALGMPAEEAAASALAAEDAGLVVGSGQGAAASFRFLHDRLREAVIELMSQDELRSLHVTVGKRLLDAGADVFEVAQHLNHAAESRSELSPELFAVNRRAAVRAVELSAHDATLVYLRTAIRHMPEDHWTADHRGCFELHLAYAESLGLAGEADAALACFDDAHAHAKTPAERATVRERESEVLHWLGKTVRAYDVVVEGLRELGVSLPSDPDQIAKESAALTEKLLLAESVERLRHAPLASGDEQLAGRLYNHAYPVVSQGALGARQPTCRTGQAGSVGLGCRHSPE